MDNKNYSKPVKHDFYSSINSLTFFGAVDYHQVDEKHEYVHRYMEI